MNIKNLILIFAACIMGALIYCTDDFPQVDKSCGILPGGCIKNQTEKLSVVEGELFTIRLESNPTIGYKWRLMNNPAGLLKLSHIDMNLYRIQNIDVDQVVMIYLLFRQCLRVHNH